MATVGTLQFERDTVWDRAIQAPLVGPGVGAILLVSLMFVTHANFRMADPEQVAFDWQIGLRLAMCGVCGLYGLAHLPTTIATLFRFPGAWGLLFAAWGTVTIPFAMNPAYAAASCATLWTALLFVPAILQQLGGRNTAVAFLVAIFMYVTISWGVYLFIPSMGRTAFTYDEVVYRMGGLGHPNDTGMQAALGIALMSTLLFVKAIRLKYMVALLALFVVTLVCTESRTAMIAAGGAAGVCLLRVRPLAPVLVALALVGLIAVAALLVSLENTDSLAGLTRSGDTTELYDLTGRVYVWKFVAGKIQQSPILGYGYNCARFVMAEYNIGKDENSSVFHPHNLFLNVMLGMGLPGGLIFLGMIASQVVALFKWPDILPDVALGVVLIGGLCEVVIFYPIPGACTLLWLIALFWRQIGASLDDVSGSFSTEAVA